MMIAKSGYMPRLSMWNTPLDMPALRAPMSTGMPPSAMPSSRSPLSGTPDSISAVATSVRVAIMPLGLDEPRPKTQSSTCCANGCRSASWPSPVRTSSSGVRSRWVSIGAYSSTVAPPPLPLNSPSALPVMSFIG
ncbi:hypothetical protein D3C78_1619180 [compost metagenome]